MKKICAKCEKKFDDADQDTICPHPHLRTAEMKAQWEDAMRLLGNQVRFNHMPAGSGKHCYAVTFEGMVCIEDFPGEFAPHLFTIDGDVKAAPLLGTVS